MSLHATAAEVVIELARRDGGWIGLTVARDMEDLLATVVEPRFPGGIVPRVIDNRLQYYLVASTENDWQRLRPLALAFVGRTLSSFDGGRAAFSDSDLFEASLASLGLSGGIIRPTGLTGDDRRRVAQALSDFVRLATTSTVAELELRTTQDILTDFRHALAAQDRPAAEDAIEELRGNLRLDGLNQLFMMIEVDSALEAWSDLWERPYFVDACRSVRPPRVSAALTRAAYWSRLSGCVDNVDVDALRSVFRSAVAPKCGGLFVGAPPSVAHDVVIPFIAGWLDGEYELALTDEHYLAMDTWPDAARQVAQRLLSARPLPHVGIEIATMPLDLGQLLMKALVHRLPAQLSEARNALAGATPGELAQLRASELLRDAVDYVLAYAAPAAITGWLEWAEEIAGADVGASLAWVRDFGTERPIWAELNTAAARDTFAAALESLAGEQPATAGVLLPSVMEAVLSDPDWPRPEFAPLYSSLLDLVLLDNRVTPAKVASTSRLVAGMLATGLDLAEYRTLLRDLADWAGAVVSSATLDRLIDLVEVTIQYPCASVDARRDLWSRVLVAFQGYQARIDVVQFACLAEIDRLIGGDAPLLGMLDALAPVRGDEPGGDEPRRFPGGGRTRVALYSLVESMARRAESILESVYPGIEVDCLSGTVSDRRLEQAAREADLFVICWTRATHAATNAIRANRGSAPLLYASGAGSTSVVREIVEKLAALGAAVPVS